MPEFAEPGDFARPADRDPIESAWVTPLHEGSGLLAGAPDEPDGGPPTHRRASRRRWRVPVAAGAAVLVGVGVFALVGGGLLDGPGGNAPAVTAGPSQAGPAGTSAQTAAGSAGSPTPSGTPAGTATGDLSPAPVTSGLSSAEQLLVDVTNQERTKHGCLPLAVDGRLVAAAGAHADDMVARHYFSHRAPDGSDYLDRIRTAGFPLTVATGENIAMGYPSAKAVMAGWMNSPGHRANILNCSFTVIGTGYDPGTVLKGYAGGAWVQVFGAL